MPDVTVDIPRTTIPQWSRVSHVSEEALWSNRLRTKLKEFEGLPQNWDTYGSQQIQERAIEVAKALLTDLAKFSLPEPQLFPVSGGGVQVELASGGRELEIELMPNGSIQYLMVSPDGSMFEAAMPNYDLESISGLVAWLRR